MQQLPHHDPEIAGPHGRAWRVDLDAVSSGQSNPPPRELSVCAWYVHAPWSHPLWPCVAVMLVSLRDVAGWPPASISLPGATHEVMVYALSPDHPVDTRKPPHYLLPCNFAGQFIEPSDDSANARVEAAVRAICNGTLNPDSDGRQQWAALFGRALFKDGADSSDFIAAGPEGMVAVGMGGANVRNLQTIVETQATLQADESKPQ